MDIHHRRLSAIAGIYSPIHFDLDGRPNGYGSKASLFILAGAATFVYTLLTITGRYPHQMNYLTKITPDNAAIQYAHALKVLRLMKLIVGIFLGVGAPIAIALYTTRPDKKQQ